MTLLIKQSEATASLRRLLFVLVDVTDGFTKETGLSSGFTIEISKAGATQASGVGSITEIGDGAYYYEITQTETNTLGFLHISIRHANCRDVDGEVQIVAFNPYTAYSTHNAAAIWSAGSRELSTPNNYKADVSALATEANATTNTSNIQTNIDANETKIDNLPTAAINADAVWDEPIADHTNNLHFGGKNQKVVPSETIGDYKADVTNLDQAISTTESNIRGGTETLETIKTDTAAILIDTDTMEADLKTEIDANETKIDALNNLSSANVQTVLENNDLDHLIQVTAGAEKPTVGSYLDKIMNKDGSQTHDPTADSLEAIRDRGDTHWITGGAGGIDAIINVIPSIPKNIDVSNTKLIRLALYLIDLIDDLPTTGEITIGTIKIERSADGGTTWSTIVNDVACSEHAGCIYYDEVFDSGTGYASGDMIKITFKGQKVTINANDYEIADATDGMVFHTRMDSGLSGGGPSAGDIADAVWDEPIVDHTNTAQFGGKNQKVVPSETLADYKASVSALATEANATTNKTSIITEVDANETLINGLNDITAASVWTETGRELSTPNNYKADVSALATESNATTNKNTIVTEVNANETKIDALNNISASEVNAEVDSALNTAIPVSPVANSINERIKQIDENPDTYKANVSALATETNATTNKTSIITEVNANETKIDALQTDLDSPNQYKADVSTLATETNATTNKNAVITQVDANETKIDTLQTDITEIKANCVKLIGAQGEWLAVEWTFSGSDNITIGMWQYDTEANWNTHNKSTGIVNHWTQSTTFSNEKPTIAKIKREAT